MTIRLLFLVSIFFSDCLSQGNEKIASNDSVKTKIISVAPPTSSLKIISGKMAEVNVEHVFYLGDNDSLLFLHFIIHNISADTIGIHLDKRMETIYSNQWGFEDTTFRNGIIDEEEMIYNALTSTEKAQLKKDFFENRLKKIPPGDSLEYYDEFWTKKDVLKQSKEALPKRPYIVVSLKGRLSFTNGKEIEDFRSGYFDKKGHDYPELPIHWPAELKKIPSNAILFHQ